MADLSQYDSVFQAAGEEWNVDPTLLKAMATQESGGKANAVSPKGAQGLMQITPDTQKYLGVTDPTDPVQSIYGAAKYMSEALDKEGSPEGALLYYHGGPGWRQAYGPESRAYVPAVTAHYVALKPQQTDQPPAQATPSPSTPAPAPQGPLILGDSLASKGGLGGTGVVGASPKAVLDSITGLPDDQVKGRDVVLSGGASNNPAQASLIYDQVQALKAKGANSVTVVGVGDRPDFQGVNDQLAIVSGRSGAKFVPLDTTQLGPDRVHPTQQGYRTLLAAATPKTTTDATPAPTPAPAGSQSQGKPMASDDLPSWLPPAPKAGGGNGTSTAPAATGTTSDGLPSWLPAAPQASPSKEADGSSTEQPWWQQAANYGAGVIGSLTHGLSFGLDNPLDRATAALFPDSAFAKLQPQREQAQQQFETANPLAAGTAQVVGSLPTYMIGEGALRAAVPVAQGSGIVPTVANLTGSAVRNAAVSGAEAAGTTDGSIADRLNAAKQGAIVGAVAGPVGDIAGAGVQKLVSGGVSAADATLGQLARQKYGIPITAADMSGNQFYRTATDQMARLPFSGTTAADAAKRTAWQSAIAKEMGENASSFTDDVMSRAKTRIGNVFDNVAKSTTVDAASTNTLVNDLAKIESDMHLTLPESELKPLKAQMDNIVDIAGKGQGTISGDSYQALTRKGAPLDRAESSNDPNVRYVAGQIRDALDDAFARSASPADQAALQEARYQYRVMRTVQDLAAGSRDGNISPDAFMQKVLTVSRRFDAPTGGIAYTGGGNIGELAKIGKLMRAAPDSGTADRALMNALIFGAGGATATLAAHPGYAVGVPAALAANRAAGAYLRSGWAADQVIQNALNPGYWPPAATSAGVAAGVNALQSR